LLASSHDSKCGKCLAILIEVLDIERGACGFCYSRQYSGGQKVLSKYVIPARRGSVGLAICSLPSSILDNIEEKVAIVDLSSAKIFADVEFGQASSVCLETKRNLANVDCAEESFCAQIVDSNFYSSFCFTDDLSCPDLSLREASYAPDGISSDVSVIEVGPVLSEVVTISRGRRNTLASVDPNLACGYEAPKSSVSFRRNGSSIRQIVLYFRDSDRIFANDFARKNLGNSYFSIYSEMLRVQQEGLIAGPKFVSLESDRRDRYTRILSSYYKFGSRYYLFSLSDFSLRVGSEFVSSKFEFGSMSGVYDGILIYEILPIISLRQVLSSLRRFLARDGFVLVRICCSRITTIFNSFSVIGSQGVDALLKFRFNSVKYYVPMFTLLNYYATKVDDDKMTGVLVFYLQV